MITIAGCIMLSIIGITFILMCIDELRTNYEIRENSEYRKEKKDLISYLKNQIDICDGCIDVMTSDLKEIMPGRAGKTYLTSEIFKNEIAKECYQDILNKIEKSGD